MVNPKLLVEPIELGAKAAASLGRSVESWVAGVAKETFAPARDAYWRLKWKAGDGTVEAQRLTFSTLNSVNLRHPINRLGDLIHGTEEAVPVARPALTSANNPVVAIERDFPEYLRRIEKAEETYEIAPVATRRNIYFEMNDIKTDFVHKLLTNWHGTSNVPGMKFLSDAELATKAIPVERVAEIRSVLTASARRQQYQTASAFEDGLERLAASQLREVAPQAQPFELSGAFALGRERFYDYSERRLTSMLSLKQEHHSKSRSGLTPKDWMPFELNDQLPNLFHGTVNRSLNSLFEERALLSSSAQRLRGMEQSTGESAHQHFPRKAVSMTRDFGTAFAYTGASPAHLTDFPVVLGIPRAITAKSWSAGLSEPGELLVERLRFGTSRLSSRPSEISHLYVPNAEVPFIEAKLQRHRLQGVRVVGFNDLKEPKWLD